MATRLDGFSAAPGTVPLQEYLVNALKYGSEFRARAPFPRASDSRLSARQPWRSALAALALALVVQRYA